MAETLREALEDIRQKLKEGVYKNEEHVRLSLVARVVQTLGWNIWDPREVGTETKTTDKNRRADMTLSNKSGSHIIIEVKAPNSDLSVALSQLSEYSEWKNQFVFGILTDGQQWWLYILDAREREIKNRCFLKLNLLRDTLDLCVSRLIELCSKDSYRVKTVLDETRKKAQKLLKGIESDSLREKEDQIIQETIRMIAQLPQELHKTDKDIKKNLRTALEGKISAKRCNNLEWQKLISQVKVASVRNPSGNTHSDTFNPISSGWSSDIMKAKKKGKKPLSVHIGEKLVKQIRTCTEILTVTATWLIDQGCLTRADPILGDSKWKNKLSFSKGSFRPPRDQYVTRLKNGVYIYRCFTAEEYENWSRRLLDDCGYKHISLHVEWEKQP